MTIRLSANAGNTPQEKSEAAREAFLIRKADEYNRASFIDSDPISVPHRFTKQQDIEIAGLFAALFAWGNRKTIIAKANELMRLMDNAPFDFILNHSEEDLKPLLGFRHRTFNDEDLLYFIRFLHQHYSGSLHRKPATDGDIHTSTTIPTLETAFTAIPDDPGFTVEKGLNFFYSGFISLPDASIRTRKHVSAPFKKSACKRLNMFLRWMVRKDNRGVDFGIWKRISPAQLICPLDVHVARVARSFGILKRSQTDWQAALELTESLRRIDPLDPVKFDFALFGLGAEERF